MIGKLLNEYGSEFNKDYDSAKSKYIDLLVTGIIDPLKAVRTALADASGVASLLGTTEVAIVEAPEEKPAMSPGGGGMGGMGGIGGGGMF